MVDPFRYIPFTKYTVLGNHFAIVDETQTPWVAEKDKPFFARLIVDAPFGVGCDNLLFVQRLTANLLEEIASVNSYRWEDPLVNDSAPDFERLPLYLFRMFETDGREAAMCGNGLIAVSTHLREQYGMTDWAYLTEIPTTKPKIRTVSCTYTDQEPYTITVYFGHSDLVSDQFVSRAWPLSVVAEDHSVELLPKLRTFCHLGLGRADSSLSETWCDSMDETWQGYLVSTGEPHLVLLPKASYSKSAITSSSKVFELFPTKPSTGNKDDLKMLGLGLNAMPSIFPNGINICLARPLGPFTVGMRSFERGIFHETLACGTGAVAVCAAASAAGLISRERATTVQPHWVQHRHLASHRVTHDENGWYLTGNAKLVYTGQFPYESPSMQEVHA